MPRLSSPRARLATAALLAGTALLAACGGSSRPRLSAGAPRTPAAVTIPTSTSAATTTIASTIRTTTTRVGRPWTGVGTILLDVVDPTRPTVQHGRTLSPSRHLPTLVRYPAVGPAGGAEVAGAPAAHGSWPLVIFAHGYNVTPATYSHLLHAWADAGFVVAAPAFPLETAGGPLDENDLDNEPADISVVITAVLARSAAATGPLAHLVAPSHIAVTGHSDGAEAALAAAYVHGDHRIGPVISMSAQGILGGPHPDPAHPLLVVQGTADTINPPARGDAVYAAAGRPRFELHLLGGGHLPPIADATPWRPIVDQVTTAFLRRYLSVGSAAVATLMADGDRPQLSTLTADP